MSLLAPNLDDRRFQDLVDDAKRLVQQRTDRWTDHNVSDPGVTLIEAVAWMTDQLLYRLNRVPDRNYVKFLELIGVHLYPPAAAHAPVTFWLSTPQPATVTIPAGTQVATVRTGEQLPVVFSTTEDRPIVTTSLSKLGSMLDGKTLRDHTDGLSMKSGVFPFSNPPKPGEALLVGLSEAAPGCVVNLRFVAKIEGVGVDPNDPPLAWEAWTGEDWAACELDRDTTGGLNRDGDVVVHVPVGHVASTIEKAKAGWLRARVTEPRDRQPAYSASPEIRGLTAYTIGGTADAMNAELVRNEVLGDAEGVPGRPVPAQARAGRGGREAARARDLRGRRVAGVDAAVELRRQRARGSALRAGSRDGPDRAGAVRAHGRRHAAALRRRAAARRHRPGPAVSSRRRPVRQRRCGVALDPQGLHPVCHAGREPPIGARWRRRRGHRDGQDPRAHRPADARPGRDRGGLRAHRPRDRAGGGAGAGALDHRRPRRGCRAGADRAGAANGGSRG